MLQISSLLVVALASGFLTGGPGPVENPAASTDPILELSAGPFPALALQAEQLYTPADPEMATSSLGLGIFLPSPGIRTCEDTEEAMCSPCNCIVIRNQVYCICP